MKIINITCDYCKISFERDPRFIKHKIDLGQNKFYCSNNCAHTAQTVKFITQCGNCNKDIETIPCTFNKSKSKKVFCNRSCSATYNNTHKTHGTRKSKLECLTEFCLTNSFSNLEMKFNSKTDINSELDIYIPKYKMAFELNRNFSL